MLKNDGSINNVRTNAYNKIEVCAILRNAPIFKFIFLFRQNNILKTFYLSVHRNRFKVVESN